MRRTAVAVFPRHSFPRLRQGRRHVQGGRRTGSALGGTGRAYLIDLDKGELLCTAPVIAFNSAEIEQGTLTVDLGYNILDAIDEQIPGDVRKPVN